MQLILTLILTTLASVRSIDQDHVLESYCTNKAVAITLTRARVNGAIKCSGDKCLNVERATACKDNSTVKVMDGIVVEKEDPKYYTYYGHMTLNPEISKTKRYWSAKERLSSRLQFESKFKKSYAGFSFDITDFDSAKQLNVFLNEYPKLLTDANRHDLALVLKASQWQTLADPIIEYNANYLSIRGSIDNVEKMANQKGFVQPPMPVYITVDENSKMAISDLKKKYAWITGYSTEKMYGNIGTISAFFQL
ncbi:hypothetical protein DSO57_1032723 [Entomophthora muscae]|uniref:Uncharacterized protein n=1 Tax=Entomophthora muscae TaxID=34485 RepID=A0ACC2RFE9_9FUNG|nr:hypothetical protein DSO57_1032723 [Entomophthora muscae]